jgi:PAS domain-containing protein
MLYTGRQGGSMRGHAAVDSGAVPTEFPGRFRPLVLVTSPMPVLEIVRLAAVLADALADWHDRDGPHLRLCPEAVRWDSAGSVVRLVRPDGPPDAVEAYTAPEQTGRLACAVDERADLYAFGVLVYRLVTGRFPLGGTGRARRRDLLTGTPRPARELVPRLPGPLDEILGQLLRTVPEDRYRTARGLAVDLDRCRRGLVASGAVEPFLLGARDVPTSPVFSGRLFAREGRLAQLWAAHERAAAGACELVRVTGDPGLGKTALLDAFTDGVLRGGGRAARGAFGADEAAPYAGFATLLSDLADQLRIEPDCPPLAEVLGPYAGPVVGLVPALAPVLDAEPEPDGGVWWERLPGTPGRARNRLAAGVRRLLSALGAPRQPLVLALDDLHRADAASVDLLRGVLADPRSAHLLVVVAYRPKEVASGHAAAALLRDPAGQRGASLPLRPLPDAALGALLADTLRSGSREAAELARTVAARTGSNPLAVERFLADLHEDGRLTFDASGPAWQWDAGRVAAAPALSDVAAAVAARVRALPAEPARLLRTLALLGDRVPLGRLAQATGQAPADLAARLRPAVRTRLVVPVAGPAYRWSHGLVRQGVQATPSAEDPRRLRLAIGRALAADPGAGADGLGHRNASAPLVTADDERAELVEANLAAGCRADRLGAADRAAEYLGHAVGLLPADAWTRRPALALAVHAHGARILADAGDRDRAARLVDRALVRVAGDLDRVRLLRLRAAIGAGGDLASTVDGLRRLGVDVPAEPADWQGAALARVARLRPVLAGPVDALATRTPAADPRVTLAVAVATDPLTLDASHHDWALLLASVAVDLVLAHGPAPRASVAFACLAVALADRAGAAPDDLAISCARLALRLLDRAPDAAGTAAVAPVVARVRPLWSDLDGDPLDRLRLAIRAADESGDPAAAAAAQVRYQAHRLVTGTPLDAVGTAVGALWPVLDRTGSNDTERALTRALDGAVRALRGPGPEPAPGPSAPPRPHRPPALPGPPSESECERGARLLRGDGGYAATVALSVATMVAHVLGDHDHAVALGRLAEDGAGRGSLLAGQAYAYHALALAARTPVRTGEDLTDLRRRHDVLDAWARRAPRAFDPPALLLAAEFARRTDPKHAMAAYQRAVEAAREHGAVAVEALAAEAGGRHALDRGDHTEAVAYLRRARSCYARWGADAKVRAVERALAEASAPVRADHSLDQLDLLAVVRTFQAISAELGLDKLLVTLLSLLVRHARADHGALFLPDGRALRLAAVAHTEPGRVVVDPDPAGPAADHAAMTVVSRVHEGRRPVRGELPPGADPYLVRHRPRSVLCQPILRGERLLGVLYLEHRAVTVPYAPEYLQLMEVLCAQAAIALDNATVHARLVEANRVLDATFDRLPLGLILLAPDLTVRRASPLAMQITGLPIEPGTPLVEYFDVLTPTDEIGHPYRFEPGFAPVGADAEPIHREIPIIAPDGERRRLRTSAIPLRDAQGVLVGVTLLVAQL